MKKSKKISAEEFDQAFDDGDVMEYLDLKTMKMHYPVQRVSIDFTQNVLEQIDHHAARIGITRTALIKVWIAERLESMEL